MSLSLALWVCCHVLRLLRELRAAFNQGPLQAQPLAQLTSKLSPVLVVVIVAFFAFIACAEMREISRRESESSRVESPLPLSKDYHFPCQEGGRNGELEAGQRVWLLMSCALWSDWVAADVGGSKQAAARAGRAGGRSSPKFWDSLAPPLMTLTVCNMR